MKNIFHQVSLSVCTPFLPAANRASVPAQHEIVHDDVHRQHEHKKI